MDERFYELDNYVLLIMSFLKTGNNEEAIWFRIEWGGGFHFQ
jgi:hypothetical protein